MALAMGRRMSPLDDESQRAIADAMAGDDTDQHLNAGVDEDALRQLAAGRGDPGEQAPAASPDDTDRALAVATQPAPSPDQAATPAPAPIRAMPQPKPRAAGGVNPELAFMAAYTQNPVLQHLLTQQQGAPKAAAEEARQKAQETRAQQKWEQERDIMAPLRAEAKRNENTVSGGKANYYQSDSEESKAARSAAATRLRADALRMAGNPDVQKLLTAHADYIEKSQLSAMAVRERLSKGELGGVADAAVSDSFRAAAQAESGRMNTAKIGDMEDKNKQAWAKIDLARNRALTPHVGAREKAVQIKNQEKLDDEVEKAEWARNALLSVAELKKGVNTGPIANWMQDFGQKLGLSSHEYDSMKSRISMVNNRIIKELSGSAVNGSEWLRMKDELSQMSDDDPNFETKLANMIELTESLKQRAINRYARREGGAPADPTNTAARMTSGKPQVRGSETAPPDATPKPAASGDAKTQAAKAWLQANPNDPKAESVRKRLQQMGAL